MFKDSYFQSSEIRQNAVKCIDYVEMEELEAATMILKAGKCPGLDNITNEMILCTFNSYLCIILLLFNKIFSTGCPIPS